ncbi:MAG: aminotransferase class I/II-fold pyridoxal phosphate-dependent enzyme [archaeon]
MHIPTKRHRKDEKRIQENSSKIYTNVAAPIQHAAITAYEPNKEIEEYMNTTRQIHRIMGQYTSEEFNKIDGLKATTPQGAFYFFLDFNDLKDDLKRKGVKTSNELMHSLISDPHHIATVTGDACMINPDNYGARIAFVDYDGKKTYDNYTKDPPKTKSDEQHFAKENAPLMVKGIEALKNYIRYITS